jgi:hypothetical protein
LNLPQSISLVFSRRLKTFASGAALALCFAAVALPSRAQNWPAGAEPATLPVYQLARPDYDPAGVRLGALLLYPAASESLAYDDNIFTSDRRRASDLVNTTTESLAIGSQWTQHSLKARLFAAQEIYADHGSNNGIVWGAEASGRADITGEAFFQLDAGFVQQPLARGTAEAGEDPKRPVFNTTDATASYVQRASRAVNRLQFSFHDVAYISARDAARSGTRYTYRDRLSYDLAPDMALFLEGALADQEWEKRATLRNFDLLTGLLGVDVEIPETFQMEVGVGVLRQSYRDSSFETLTTPTASERLVWNVLPLTSILAAVDRTVIGTETFCEPSGPCLNPSGGFLPGAPGLPAERNSLEMTTAELGIQHEFLHDILGEVRARYERDHFDFNGLTDRTYALRAGVRYLINRFLEADLEYTYRQRTANLPADRTFNSGPFSENVIALTLKAGL